MSSALTIIVFGRTLALNRVGKDVLRMMVGVMMLCVATIIDRSWWTAFRLFLYHERLEQAAFFMTWAHVTVATAASLGLVAYFLHIYPDLRIRPFGRAAYWIGAGVFLAVYLAAVA